MTDRFVLSTQLCNRKTLPLREVCPPDGYSGGGRAVLAFWMCSPVPKGMPSPFPVQPGESLKPTPAPRAATPSPEPVRVKSKKRLTSEDYAVYWVILQSYPKDSQYGPLVISASLWNGTGESDFEGSLGLIPATVASSSSRPRATTTLTPSASPIRCSLLTNEQRALAISRSAAALTAGSSGSLNPLSAVAPSGPRSRSPSRVGGRRWPASSLP